MQQGLIVFFGIENLKVSASVVLWRAETKLSSKRQNTSWTLAGLDSLELKPAGELITEKSF